MSDEKEFIAVAGEWFGREAWMVYRRGVEHALSVSTGPGAEEGAKRTAAMWNAMHEREAR